VPRIFIILSITFFLFFGCEKKNTTVTNDCPTINFPDLDTFLLKNFLFNPGSYWVYYDSLNNTYDSCYQVTQVKKDTTITIEHQYPDHGYCDYTIRYAYNNKSNSGGLFDYIIDSNCINIWSPIYNNYISLCKSISDSLFPIGTSTEKFYPTFQIDSTLYTNVMRFTYPSYDSTFFYLKYGVGIVKTEMYSNNSKSTHKLVRHHIN
jgi:hypothetical protein